MIRTVLKSSNTKLVGNPKHPCYSGKQVSSSFREVGPTCPLSCAVADICYAKQGNVNIWQSRSAYSPEDGKSLYWFITEEMPTRGIIRHHVSGDFGKDHEPDLDYIGWIKKAHQDAPLTTGFTYTHFSPDELPEMNDVRNLTINFSCETEERAVELFRSGHPTVMAGKRGETRKHWKVDGVRFVVCPNVTTGIGCVDCKLCTLKDRQYVIVFPEHGSRQRKN